MSDDTEAKHREISAHLKDAIDYMDIDDLTIALNGPRYNAAAVYDVFKRGMRLEEEHTKEQFVHPVMYMMQPFVACDNPGLLHDNAKFIAQAIGVLAQFSERCHEFTTEKNCAMHDVLYLTDDKPRVLVPGTEAEVSLMEGLTYTLVYALPSVLQAYLAITHEQCGMDMRTVSARFFALWFIENKRNPDLVVWRMGDDENKRAVLELVFGLILQMENADEYVRSTSEGKFPTAKHLIATVCTELLMPAVRVRTPNVLAYIAPLASRIDRCDEQGFTPLYHALHDRWKEGVLVLANAGASPIIVDKNTNKNVLYEMCYAVTDAHSAARVRLYSKVIQAWRSHIPYQFLRAMTTSIGDAQELVQPLQDPKRAFSIYCADAQLQVLNPDDSKSAAHEPVPGCVLQGAHTNRVYQQYLLEKQHRWVRTIEKLEMILPNGLVTYKTVLEAPNMTLIHAPTTLALLMHGSASPSEEVLPDFGSAIVFVRLYDLLLSNGLLTDVIQQEQVNPSAASTTEHEKLINQQCQQQQRTRVAFALPYVDADMRNPRDRDFCWVQYITQNSPDTDNGLWYLYPTVTVNRRTIPFEIDHQAPPTQESSSSDAAPDATKTIKVGLTLLELHVEVQFISRALVQRSVELNSERDLRIQQTAMAHMAMDTEQDDTEQNMEGGADSCSSSDDDERKE